MVGSMSGSGCGSFWRRGRREGAVEGGFVSCGDVLVGGAADQGGDVEEFFGGETWEGGDGFAGTAAEEVTIGVGNCEGEWRRPAEAQSGARVCAV